MISSGSTTGYEALALGKPVIYVNPSGSAWRNSAAHHYGLEVVDVRPWKLAKLIAHVTVLAPGARNDLITQDPDYHKRIVDAIVTICDA